jgi:tetraacyldisaccharide 4'-kinase
MLLRLRLALYRWGMFTSHRAQVPVIVVGNVITGGAGKTPVVMALVQHLRARGLHPGVISRGYGRSSNDCREVQEHSLTSEVGDEAQLIQRSCQVPVFIAAKRIQAAQALLAQHPQTDVLLCDDGLQHLALHRELDICVFDERGIGNGWVLPAGPLREPWPRKVDLVLHTGVTAAFAGFKARRELAPYALRQDGSKVALTSLRGKRLVAVAGIANPQNFFSMLRASGLTLVQTIALPDHYSFDDWHVSLQPDDTLVCTEKDAAKLWRSQPTALAVPLALELESAFLSALEAMLPASLKAKLSSPEHSTKEPPHGQQTS